MNNCSAKFGTHDLKSGQLEQVLVENENAAGRLWDMSAGQIRRGDYQLIVRYGDFLAQQPELMKLAEQLGRQGRLNRSQRRCPDGNLPAAPWCGNRPPCRNRWMGSSKAMTFYACCLRAGTLRMTELEYEFYRRLVEKNSF